MAKIDEARQLLDDLQSRVTDINDIAITRTNGLNILSLRKSISQGDEKSERMIGAMASALFGTSNRASQTLLNGDFQSLNIQVSKGNIFLVYTGKVILIALTKQEPNLGLLSLELEDAVNKLNEIF